jgi:hypothetical protein
MTLAADEQVVDQSHLIDDEGVDRSLIRWMLSLTPTERLQYLDDNDRVLASAKRLPDGPR